MSIKELKEVSVGGWKAPGNPMLQENVPLPPRATPETLPRALGVEEGREGWPAEATAETCKDSLCDSRPNVVMLST